MFLLSPACHRPQTEARVERWFWALDAYLWEAVGSNPIEFGIMIYVGKVVLSFRCIFMRGSGFKPHRVWDCDIGWYGGSECWMLIDERLWVQTPQSLGLWCRLILWFWALDALYERPVGSNPIEFGIVIGWHGGSEHWMHYLWEAEGSKPIEFGIMI